MRLLLFLLPVYILCLGSTKDTFRNNQLNYTRVREAYSYKEKDIVKLLAEKSLSRDSLTIYLRAFKTEKLIEIWAKNSSNSQYILLKKIPICEISGELGPKRRSRDLQVPEGFYRIVELNPYSKYYLSMEINYPNASDSIRGVRGRLGNEIFIHGSCVSSGCLAINDDKIRELFVYCIEAYNAGQKEIGITIFPAQMTDSTYTKLIGKYSKDKDKLSLWTDLKKAYDLFEQTQIPPKVTFQKNGSHLVEPSILIKDQWVADSICITNPLSLTDEWCKNRLIHHLEVHSLRIAVNEPNIGIQVSNYKNQIPNSKNSISQITKAKLVLKSKIRALSQLLL